MNENEISQPLPQSSVDVGTSQIVEAPQTEELLDSQLAADGDAVIDGLEEGADEAG